MRQRRCLRHEPAQARKAPAFRAVSIFALLLVLSLLLGGGSATRALGAARSVGAIRAQTDNADFEGTWTVVDGANPSEVATLGIVATTLLVDGSI